jgi:sulfonate dioxygenase
MIGLTKSGIIKTWTFQYKYTQYLPVYDNTTVFPPTEPFVVVDKGTLADKAKTHLFGTNDPNVSITKLTPRIGTEIKGLQLSKLSDAQKNELALLIEERGVVIFRAQDFKDIGSQKQKEFGEYFVKFHVHVSLSIHSQLNEFQAYGSLE